MALLVWDKVGERFYETGVDKGVLYVQDTTGAYGKGVAWSGLSSVQESPSGAESTAIYADNIKYLDLISKEDFGATIEAYTYPEEFEICDGSASPVSGLTIGQQSRRAFGFCYRTKIGNDVANDDYGYKIHIVYNCKAAPSSKSYQTINDSPEAITFSWEINTTPVNITGYKPTSYLTIDSTKFTTEDQKAKLTALENKLYGTAESDAELPTPDEVVALLKGTTVTEETPKPKDPDDTEGGETGGEG